MDNEKFIFCLEGVRDIDDHNPTNVVKCLEELIRISLRLRLHDASGYTVEL